MCMYMLKTNRHFLKVHLVLNLVSTCQSSLWNEKSIHDGFFLCWEYFSVEKRSIYYNSHNNIGEGSSNNSNTRYYTVYHYNGYHDNDDSNQQKLSDNHGEDNGSVGQFIYVNKKLVVHYTVGIQPLIPPV